MGSQRLLAKPTTFKRGTSSRDLHVIKTPTFLLISGGRRVSQGLHYRFHPDPKSVKHGNADTPTPT